MKKTVLLGLLLPLFITSCSQKAENVEAPLQQDSLKIAKDSIKTEEIEEEKEYYSMKWNTFKDIPIQYGEITEAHAGLYVDRKEAVNGGNLYVLCDFETDRAFVKVDGKFEKLKNTGGGYIEDAIYENERYRLKLELNDFVSEKEVIEPILDGDFTLKGKAKLINIETGQEIENKVFVFGRG